MNAMLKKLPAQNLLNASTLSVVSSASVLKDSKETVSSTETDVLISMSARLETIGATLLLSVPIPLVRSNVNAAPDLSDSRISSETDDLAQTPTSAEQILTTVTDMLTVSTPTVVSNASANPDSLALELSAKRTKNLRLPNQQLQLADLDRAML